LPSLAHTCWHFAAQLLNFSHALPTVCCRQAYEELLSLQRQNDILKAANAEAVEAAELSAGEISGLKARLAEVSGQLDDEKTARQLAAAEAEAR
jgi:hypothetical protein